MSGSGRQAAPLPPAAAESEAQQEPTQQHPQAQYFDEKEAQILQASITPEVDAKLARVAAGIPGLSADSRVLDVGAGTGALIPHLQVSCMPATGLDCLRLSALDPG